MNASDWLRENDPTWGREKKQQHGGHLAKLNSTKKKRIRRGKVFGQNRSAGEPVKSFVERNRGSRSDDCLFVPAAQDGIPASVVFCGKNISAARYMCLLTNGTPPSEGMVVRHKCGNGHLSCVNPAHLLWGTQGDNIGDMTKHRHAGADVQDKIDAIGE